MRAAALLFPGEGIFVTSPSATNILFVGDVLDARNYGIQTNSLRSGFELVGSKQPLTASIPNLGLTPPGRYDSAGRDPQVECGPPEI